MTGYPRAEKNTRAYTHLSLGCVWVLPTDKKSCLYLSPLDTRRIPDTYTRIIIPMRDGH
jgi:hypothetical protein